MKVRFILRLVFLLAILAIGSPRGFAQGGTPVFEKRYTPVEQEAPVRGYAPPSKPIPRGWLLAGDTLVTLICIVVLVAAARAWRASNIFERKYRFPFGEPAALRFGGKRSGGLMAVIEPAKEEKDA